MPIVPYAKEVGNLHRLQHLMRNVDVTSKYRGLDLCCFEDRIDRSYFVKGADAWRDLHFEGWQRYHARRPRVSQWHSLEKFALLRSERNDFYTAVPQGWQHESNRFLGARTPMMFSYLVDHFRTSNSKVWEHLGRSAEVETEWTTLGACLQKLRHVIVSRLGLDDMTCVCGEGGFLIQVSQGMVRK